jgi:cytosine/adenosine deaminase-related metal-dependent hydrolase
MKRFSAQFIYTNSGPPIKRGLISVDNDGTILSVENYDCALKENQSVEFYNGIIIPGFVNCHSHLELSHLKGVIDEGNGLGDFLMKVRNVRNIDPDDIISSAHSADRDLCNEGIVLCADICNTTDTFEMKKKSRIQYLNMLEVFGIIPEKADQRMEEIISVAKKADEMLLPYFLVPHSVYSVSLPLFRLLKEKTLINRVTSIHFMETESEVSFISNHSGPLRKSYEEAGLSPKNPEMPENHATAILNEVTPSGNLILVHNTYADRNTIKDVKKRGNTFWCLCPDSNLYIEKKVPPVEVLISEGCEIVIGTDSLASNKKLSILSELKTLQQHFPAIPLEILVRWATSNGAKALGKDDIFGKIVSGKKPGLLLLQDLDLQNFKLLPETSVTRLV